MINNYNTCDKRLLLAVCVYVHTEHVTAGWGRVWRRTVMPGVNMDTLSWPCLRLNEALCHMVSSAVRVPVLTAAIWKQRHRDQIN